MPKNKERSELVNIGWLAPFVVYVKYKHIYVKLELSNKLKYGNNCNKWADKSRLCSNSQ